jgi:hypothetical protein
MKLGRGEEYPKLFPAAEAYAIDPIEHCEQNLNRGVDAELMSPVP